MPLPRWVARLNKRVTNRFLEPIARRFSGFGIVHHVGRSTGRDYQTPVNVFDADGRCLVALTYGPRADWFQNVRAGPVRLEVRRTVHEVRSVELVGRETAWPYLPALVRIALRVLAVRDFALLSLANASSEDEASL